MINLVVVEGAAGVVRRSPLRKLVKQIIRNLNQDERQRISASFHHSSVLPVLKRVRANLVSKRIRRYDNAENVLVLVGKSLGGVWCLDRIPDAVAYSRVYLVTIDPHRPGDQPAKHGVDNQRLTRGWNVFQLQEFPRGAGVASAKVTNVEVIRVGINHWTITQQPEVEASISAALASALAAD